jgi:hypothetical protein
VGRRGGAHRRPPSPRLFIYIVVYMVWEGVVRYSTSRFDCMAIEMMMDEMTRESERPPAVRTSHFFHHTAHHTASRSHHPRRASTNTPLPCSVRSNHISSCVGRA